MKERNISSIRNALEFLEGEGELVRIRGEVDPVYEISGIQKSLEEGPALLFENIKGYPGIRNLGNLFARLDRVARLFGVEEPRKLKFRCQKAIKSPIAPVVVEKAPCHEIVLTSNLDVMATLPILKHTEFDGGRLMGGGIILASPPYYRTGSDLSLKRMNFRGKDWASLFIGAPTHLGLLRFTERRGENIPLTINICPPPAVMMVAGAFFARSVVPYGSDELGIAGALQGFPVEICKARTVDAYAIAQSEWVIEGYLTPELVWETEEAERIGKARVAPFFPEWTGYLGNALQASRFQVTAITHRKDRPIFFSPLAHSYEGGMGHPMTEGSFFEMAEKMNPGFVQDVVLPPSLLWAGGIVFQVKKRGGREEGFQKNVLMAAIADTAGLGLRLAVVVDDDVDISNGDDILWAIATRCNPATDMVRGPTAIGRISFQPEEGAGTVIAQSKFEGAIGLDATFPLAARDVFRRPHYPVEKVDLTKWISSDVIDKIKSRQSEYARLMAKYGI